MEAWEIIRDTFDRGDAEELSKLFGKSSEWWSSHGRRPKTEDYHKGSGNASTLTHWLHYMRQRKAVNLNSAIRLHKAVTATIDDLLGINLPIEETVSLRVIRAELRKEYFDVANVLDEQPIEKASNDDLTRWDRELEELEEKTARARARIRMERASRSLQSTQNEFKRQA